MEFVPEPMVFMGGERTNDARTELQHKATTDRSLAAIVANLPRTSS
jgi:hypothetical protein